MHAEAQILYFSHMGTKDRSKDVKRAVVVAGLRPRRRLKNLLQRNLDSGVKSSSLCCLLCSACGGLGLPCSAIPLPLPRLRSSSSPLFGGDHGATQHHQEDQAQGEGDAHPHGVGSLRPPFPFRCPMRPFPTVLRFVRIRCSVLLNLSVGFGIASWRLM